MVRRIATLPLPASLPLAALPAAAAERPKIAVLDLRLDTDMLIRVENF